MKSEDKIVFAKAETVLPISRSDHPPWTLLVVDDDSGVHDVTKQVLRNVQFENRPLEILSAYSGSQAVEILTGKPDIAVILLDVVMENNEAGFEVVEFIRNVQNNFFIRIILRTGEPGMAPEKKIILDYDINDYREKTELTATKLFTTVISSLRDFASLVGLDQCRRGFHRIADSSKALQQARSLKEYAEEVLKQVLSLLDFDNTGNATKAEGFTLWNKQGDIRCIAGTGRFSDRAYQEGSIPLPGHILEYAARSIAEKGHVQDGEFFMGFIPMERRNECCLIYLQGSSVTDMGLSMLKNFFTCVRMGLDNMIELFELRHRQG